MGWLLTDYNTTQDIFSFLLFLIPQCSIYEADFQVFHHHLQSSYHFQKSQICLPIINNISFILFFPILYYFLITILKSNFCRCIKREPVEFFMKNEAASFTGTKPDFAVKEDRDWKLEDPIQLYKVTSPSYCFPITNAER